jgi:hypothetical protein
MYPFQNIEFLETVRVSPTFLKSQHLQKDTSVLAQTFWEQLQGDMS